MCAVNKYNAVWQVSVQLPAEARAAGEVSACQGLAPGAGWCVCVCGGCSGSTHVGIPYGLRGVCCALCARGVAAIRAMGGARVGLRGVGAEFGGCEFGQERLVWLRGIWV